MCGYETIRREKYGIFPIGRLAHEVQSGPMRRTNNMLHGNMIKHEDDTIIHDMPITQVISLEERVKALRKEAEELEKKVKLAKGTGDVQEQAQEAVRLATATRPATLVEQIETHLRQKFMSPEELSRAIGVSTDKVVAAVKTVKTKVHNLGTRDRPRWTWKLDNAAEPKDLRALVERLISYAPMEFRQIVEATGVRDGLIQGHMVEIRKLHDVFDMGTPGRARWFMMPPNARNARLQVKKRKPTPAGGVKATKSE